MPLCYGGEGWPTEVMDAGGGLCTRAFPATSTVSLTQLHQSLDALFATTPIP